MIIRKDIDFSEGLTPEQIQMLEALKDVTPEPDEDSPAFTKEELVHFKKMADQKREERRKQSVTLRLSPQSLSKARSLGKGYTSVLSRILENALNDNKLIEQYL